MVGHTDSISSLSIDSSGTYVFSGGHDGSVRAWDVRKFQCLYEIPAHRKKFDESVNVVLRHPTLPLLASGGADALVKIFKTS
jgi:striatin 1/3/4